MPCLPRKALCHANSCLSSRPSPPCRYQADRAGTLGVRGQPSKTVAFHQFPALFDPYVPGVEKQLFSLEGARSSRWLQSPLVPIVFHLEGLFIYLFHFAHSERHFQDEFPALS